MIIEDLLSYMVYTMIADDLATQGVRTLSAFLLTFSMFSHVSSKIFFLTEVSARRVKIT